MRALPSAPLAGTAHLARFTVSRGLLGLLAKPSSPAGREPACDEEGEADAQAEHQQVAEIRGHRAEFAAVQELPAARSSPGRCAMADVRRQEPFRCHSREGGNPRLPPSLDTWKMDALGPRLRGDDRVRGVIPAKAGIQGFRLHSTLEDGRPGSPPPRGRQSSHVIPASGVIPAKAGIQGFRLHSTLGRWTPWVPASAGTTEFGVSFREGGNPGLPPHSTLKDGRPGSPPPRGRQSSDVISLRVSFPRRRESRAAIRSRFPGDCQGLLRPAIGLRPAAPSGRSGKIAALPREPTQ